MESVLVQKSFDGGVLFRSISLDNHFPFMSYPTLPPPASKQPPLLPLPSANLAWRGMPRQKTRQKHLRYASTSPKKSGEKSGFAHVPVPIPGAVRVEEEVGEEVLWTGTVYSVSPPPSSVPIPRFVLVGGKCERGKRDDGEVDACATNELRRLLNL